MKLRSETNLKLFLTLLLTLVTMSARAQTLTVTAESESLRTVLKKIETASEYIFVYNARSMDVNRIVSIKAVNEPVGKVLEKLLAGTDLTYEIDGRQVALYHREKKAETGQMSVRKNEPLVVKGKILDRGGRV